MLSDFVLVTSCLPNVWFIIGDGRSCRWVFNAVSGDKSWNEHNSFIFIDSKFYQSLVSLHCYFTDCIWGWRRSSWPCSWCRPAPSPPASWPSPPSCPRPPCPSSRRCQTSPLSSHTAELPASSESPPELHEIWHGHYTWEESEVSDVMSDL